MIFHRLLIIGLVLAAIALIPAGFGRAAERSVDKTLIKLEEPKILYALETPPSEAYFKSSYVLGAGERIKISVFGEDDLSGVYLVNEEGFIAFPLIGGVRAAGQTLAALQAEMTQRLADGYLVQPRMTLEIAQFRPVYVMGEVQSPGRYDYAADMTVRRAVALAGGFTFRARRQTMLVTRTDPQSVQGVQNVHDDQAKSAGQTLPIGIDDKVYPGDVITIRRGYF
jgi:polysaccharide export outer membrane protein